MNDISLSRRCSASLGALLALLMLVIMAPPAAATFPGDEGKIAFVALRVVGDRQQSDIMTVNPDGSDLQSLLSGQDALFNPIWSPDGSKIAYGVAANSTYNIHMMDADGSNQVQLTTGAPLHSWPAWSADGSKIAYWSSQDNMVTDIRVLDLSTGQSSVLIPDLQRTWDGAVEYSPDGRHIAWTDASSSYARLMVADADGQNIRVLEERSTTDGACCIAARWLSWAPSSQSIHWEILNFDEDTTTYAQVAAATGSVEHERVVGFAESNHVGRPEPSPAGHRYVSTQTHRTLVITDLNGSVIKQLTQAGEQGIYAIFHPDWQANASQTPTDTTPPTVSFNPADGTQVPLGGSLVVNYACADEDGGSSVKSCEGTAANGTTLDTSAVGSQTFAVTATDNAGNMVTSTVTYYVIWEFGGFAGPVNGGSTVNQTKAGGVVPVKFSLGADYGLAILATGYPKSANVACDSTATADPLEEYATSSPGNNTLTYDAASGLYSYNWKTDKSWSGTCRQLIVKLADGAEYRATFQFK